MLRSTLWMDRESREIFITALLLAEPQEFAEAQPQIAVKSLAYTGYEVPPGWYGFVPAAGIGIINCAGVPTDAGYAALERLCAPDQESRSPEYEGRRLVRVNGGYLVLNYIKYRDRDYTAPNRAKRYRERLKAQASHRDGVESHRNTVTPTRKNGSSRPHVTHAEGISRSIEDSEPPQPPLELPANLATDSWKEWIAQRRKRRWPCDNVTLRKQLDVLTRYSLAVQREIIDTSINSGWQGLFAPKGKQTLDNAAALAGWAAQETEP